MRRRQPLRLLSQQSRLMVDQVSLQSSNGRYSTEVREICRQVCCEKGGDVLGGVVSADHTDTFVPVLPKLAVI